MMKKTVFALPLLAMVLLAFAADAGSPQPASAAVGTFKVKVGGGETGYNVNAFLPGEVTVDKGSTIAFTFSWFEPHFVGFLPVGAPEPTTEPAVSPQPVSWPNTAAYVYSGTIFGDPKAPTTFNVTFPTEGDYSYLCGIHPGMTAKVHVKASGGQDQAAIDSAGTAEYNTRLAAVKAAAAAANKPAAVTPQADGTNKFTLVVGADTEKGDNAQQYFPPTLNVKEGDTVVWTSSLFTPHTVTFGTPPPGDPFALPVTVPAGGVYLGTGLVNSGIMGKDPANPPGVLSFTLKFGKAGSYDYVCILHADQGMKGKVVVAAAPATPTPSATASPTATSSPTTAPRPPATGSVERGGSGNSAWLAAAAAMAAVAIGGATFAASRKR